MLKKLDSPDWETCCTDGDGFHYATGLELAENLRHKTRWFRQHWLLWKLLLVCPVLGIHSQQGVKSLCWYFHAQQIPGVFKAWLPIRWGSPVTALASAALLPKLLSFLDSRNQYSLGWKVFVCPGLLRSPPSVWRAAPQIPPATKQGAAEELLCSGAVLDKHLSDSERVTIYLCSPISKEKELFQNVLCKELCKRLKILRNPVQRPGERLWKSYLFSSESHGLAVSVGLDAADVMGCGPAQNLHQMLQGALQETKQTQLQQGSSSGICHPPHEAALAKDGFRLRALLQDSSS